VGYWGVVAPSISVQKAVRRRIWRTTASWSLCVVGLVLAGDARAADPLIAAAGDISCDPADATYNAGNGSGINCRQRATSDLLVGRAWDGVLLLGDNQYLDGSLAKYQTVFGPTWGRLGALLRPAVGNHEYVTPGAVGYYDYFGAAAGPRFQGWYSYDLGTWHLVALNSNCTEISGGCGPNSPQVQWLVHDLETHPRACTLAYWHHPRFSSGQHGDDASTGALWQALYAAGVDVILVGHDHDYERFAPQTPDGGADPTYGIREFVVGIGGRETRPFANVAANSEVRDATTLGALTLRLRPGGYDWDLLPLPGSGFDDSGSAPCHNAPLTETLHLGRGRFTASVTWDAGDGITGVGHVTPPATDGSGVFWFFGPDNWELMVKVIDGCSLNHRYWVFSAATTDVEYTLTVTDTQTGAVVRYENPQGRRAPAVTDTSAFATCP
jgi:hypothetical protein